MATHSSILAWRITWTEEPGRLQSMRSQRVGQDWSDFACMHAGAPVSTQGEPRFNSEGPWKWRDQGVWGPGARPPGCWCPACLVFCPRAHLDSRTPWADSSWCSHFAESYVVLLVHTVLSPGTRIGSSYRKGSENQKSTSENKFTPSCPDLPLWLLLKILPLILSFLVRPCALCNYQYLAWPWRCPESLTPEDVWSWWRM